MEPSPVHHRIDAARAIAYAMAGMSERHRAVIALRWAGADGEMMTLRDVGRLLGLSAERVRRNERDAMAYMSDRIGGLSWGSEGWRANAESARSQRARPRGPRNLDRVKSTCRSEITFRVAVDST